VFRFTSALYLGLRHPSASLQPWAALTTGEPAALGASPLVHRLARDLAVLQGCECATLGPSTLHLFWDLFGLLPCARTTICVDAGAYPIARWGAERAAARGAVVRGFRHHDAGALRRLLLSRRTGDRLPPVVVADGFCPGCGRPAPVSAYLRLADEFGGLLVLDDTQALGIMGRSPGPQAPYGEGGGGMLRWSELSSRRLILLSSLAKGFGVPVAALCGSRSLVAWFEAHSETRVHCSPPSAATIHAVEHALEVNRTRGDSLRLRLARLVGHFRERLRAAGFAATGGLFPMQTLAPVPRIDAVTLHRRLCAAGVSTVLHRGHMGREPRISFLITARHATNEIDEAVDALSEATRATGTATTLRKIPIHGPVNP
jgi:8-amino-7-oxononanoate synthase